MAKCQADTIFHKLENLINDTYFIYKNGHKKYAQLHNSIGLCKKVPERQHVVKSFSL